MAIRKTISLSKLQKIRNYISSRKDDRKKVGLLIDGPNMLRKEFNINLHEIRQIIEEYGNIKVARVFLNQYAGDKLVEAIENQGFEPIITSGDVDVRMAVEAMELIYNDSIDALALVTRDADFKAVLKKAMEMGKETIIIGAEPGFSAALKNSADIAIILNQDDFDEVEEDNNYSKEIEHKNKEKVEYADST
ncbi:TIGR00288 family protein [Archaeoglobus sulfaticallidus PM70-1]|uniref:TIGR00288 family protein n=1 Tax=Archaeoglobus sulfaticallidus PM70-1 TaxID=387631 RepID=N0BMV0_9EURY|nr:TIGR00288 family NYN domain-containing protein [Archaeoglobus sulfaticallidus]AGK61941.1 TIGR00288 family protein [Archaeoglobus sulfaticallidus PM70-1]